MNSTASSTPSSTCQTCHVAFPEPSHQRDHFKSDWHKYNLKRRVAQIPPLDLAAFTAKINAGLELANLKAAAEVPLDYICECCRKSYRSENAFDAHLISKKHRTLAANYDPSNNEPALSQQEQPATPRAESREEYWRTQFEEAESIEDIQSLVQQKLDESPRLATTDCIFCPAAEFESVESALHHMSVQHSFMIPDIEYLVDLEGLLEHLGQKVSLGNVCLSCNEDGPVMYSMDAVRSHMKLKGHCKIAYETEEDRMELAEYYDFSSTWEDEQESQQPSESLVILKKPVKRIDSKAIQQRTQSGNHRALVKSGGSDAPTESMTAVMKVRAQTLAVQREMQVQNKRVERQFKEFQMRRGMKLNNCSKQHFVSVKLRDF
ncbi:C2H2 type zinc-finger-domain-containing protein [Chytriomyces cf. hyalinus JEL632]|nr:C2H2 type zinc-finger-domain-containing protein [Chytriomyces cf. hyalinus JEL632]